MTIIYYITLIVICFMIYDLAYNRNEGFQHRGGEIRPIQTATEETTDKPSIIGTMSYTTYILSDKMAKMIIMIPYNFIRAILKIIKSVMDYFLDILKVFTNMFYSILKPTWEATKRLYYKLIELFKDTMKSIRNMPETINKFSDTGMNMMQKGIKMVGSIMESFASIVTTVFSTLAKFPETFFNIANKSIEVGLNMFVKGMTIPEKMLGSAMNMINKI